MTKQSQKNDTEEVKIKTSIKSYKKEVDKNFQKKRKWSKTKRNFLRHLWALRLGLVVGFIALFYIIFLGARILIINTGFDYYISLAKDFIFTPSEKILSLDGRTNILILGKGGADHEAPDLTDTMMLASISHVNSSITLISLPRDIWIPELRAKLNSAYYWGNQKQDGGGVTLASSVVEKVVGVPIHYNLVVDFTGLEKVVDVLGGVDVRVDTSFIDNRFPLLGHEDEECSVDDPRYNVFEFYCRYETVSFEKGLRNMDSEAVLKFVRSRNAEGDEGTDLARGARQQNVIAGIKDKLLSKDIFASPQKLIELWKVFEEVTETDIGDSAAAILTRRAYDGQKMIQSHLFPDILLLNPPYEDRYDNLYVFIPSSEDGSWSVVHEWVNCIIDGRVCDEILPQDD